MNKMKTAKSMRKPPPLASIRKSNGSSPPAADLFDAQLELELCWCVQQLENALASGKLNQKLAEDTAKNVRILKSNTAPLVKKRQIMKAALGDYRAKMKEEEKKMALAAKQIKFIKSADLSKKCSFVKKSAIQSSGKDFRFDFKIPVQDNNNESLTDGAQDKTIASSSFLSKDLNLTTGSGFKFNFVIDEPSDDLNFNDLKIKN